MSSALVPGRILLDAPESIAPVGNLLLSSSIDTPGDMGPVWSSAMGGGEGSRGEDEGETALVAAMVDDGRRRYERRRYGRGGRRRDFVARLSRAVFRVKRQQC